MDGIGVGAKAKTLTNKERKRKRMKFKPQTFSEDETSQLVISDEVKEEKSKRRRSEIQIRFKEEMLNIKCYWDNCTQAFADTEGLLKHLITHADGIEDLNCKWTDCPNPNGILSNNILTQHVAYHAYLVKLVEIGEDVLKRNHFPECSLERKYSIDIPKTNYTCDWKGCENFQCNTIQELLEHVECHVWAAPSGEKVDSVEVIPCLWLGCNSNFSTRYLLWDHIRVHTNGKVIACPKCLSLFSTKTSFSDHRNRQLKAAVRSYQCSQCSKLFSAEKLLNDHMSSHINHYKCLLCDMISPKQSQLAAHYRYTHMDVQPFSCQVCKKMFVTESNLNAHILTHQVKPFKCDHCEFDCKTKVGLQSHMNKVHSLLEQDMENHMEWKMMSVQKRMKKNVVPHIFTCQEDKKRTCPRPVRKAAAKRARECALYECQACKSRFKTGDYLTDHLIKIHDFRWPSGHCRFRYRKDTDEIHRLQTVRYESLEVTEQMIQSGYMHNTTFVKHEEDGYKLSVLQDPIKQEIEIGPVELSEPHEKDTDESNNAEARKIIIIVEDVDGTGNVVQSRELNSTQMCLYDTDETVYQVDEKPAGSRDMRVFETVEIKKETALYECQGCKSPFKTGGDLTNHLIKIHNFNWPPGHCKFRYRKDADKIHRLQMIRYESLGVTEQMIQNGYMQKNKNSSAVGFNSTFVKHEEDGYKLSVLQDSVKQEIEIGPVVLSEPQEKDAGESKIIIIVEDVDESGNVVHSRELDSIQMNLCDTDGIVNQPDGKPPGNRDIPVCEMVELKMEHDCS